MTWKDKLEIGLKEDAPFRKDNLPASEVRGPESRRDPDGHLKSRWRAERSSETQAKECLKPPRERSLAQQGLDRAYSSTST
jgi:hypothetical protein